MKFPRQKILYLKPETVPCSLNAELLPQIFANHPTRGAIAKLSCTRIMKMMLTRVLIKHSAAPIAYNVCAPMIRRRIARCR